MTCNNAAQLTQPTCNSHSNSHSNSHNYPLYEGGGSCVSSTWQHHVTSRPSIDVDSANGRRQRMAGQRAGVIGGPWPPHGSASHKAARAHFAYLLATVGPMPCAYPDCTSGPGGTRLTIRTGMPWDAAHDDDHPGRYLGPACRRCNRGVKRRHGRKGSRVIPRSTSVDASAQSSRAEQREQDRIKRINERESARRQRMIMPTISSDDRGQR